MTVTAVAAVSLAIAAPTLVAAALPAVTAAAAPEAFLAVLSTAVQAKLLAVLAAAVAAALPVVTAGARTTTKAAIPPFLVATTVVVAGWVTFALSPLLLHLGFGHGRDCGRVREATTAEVTTVTLFVVAPQVAATARWFAAPRTASFTATMIVTVGGVAVVYFPTCFLSFPSCVRLYVLRPCCYARGLG